MRTNVCLGKTGDVLSILPILHHLHATTGQKSRLMVSAQYADILKAAPYVEPVIYPGDFGDLAGALLTLKKLGHEAIPLQVYARAFPCQKRTPSFQLDQWVRGNAVEHFNEWPLVLSGRNRQRESNLVKSVSGKKPLILFADYSESSPFADKERLASALKANFGATYNIIRLSDIRAEHFFDFVGLYNKASLLVTIETAHLHLSRASEVPVVALATDLPTRWHGSAHHPRLLFHCRYADSARREPELLRTIQRQLNTGKRIEPAIIQTYFEHGYNPSIVEGSEVMTYRFHPAAGWKTRIAIAAAGVTSSLKLPEQFDDFSHEDARLFQFRDKLHLSLVLAIFEHGLLRCIVAYGELVKKDDDWTLKEIIVPEFGQNNWGGMEKNWGFFEHKGRLMALYESSPEQIVIELDEKKVLKIHRSPPPKWAFGEMRGGAMIEHNGQWLRFFHSHTTQGHRNSWVYAMGAAIMESKPPFSTVAISQFPILSGNEAWHPTCRHWKQNVIFPGGLKNGKNGWSVAVGLNDCRCAVVEISESDLNL